MTSSSQATYRAIDAAVDAVLRELQERGQLTIRSNPASNLRDALVAGLNERGFDVVRTGKGRHV